MDRDILGERYQLLGVLGAGGMARVYLARDDVLGRHVALKVLRERYADDEGFVERFRRKAINAASLNHPSVVQVYDQGRAEDGTYFMAMEYVPGGTLKERIAERGPLDPPEAANIASRVADALAEPHRRGIVHRDVKPHNVLLSASGEAKVADFGIARAASASTITETNLLLGTAAYMSPEQVAGERVGPPSDLYSLGVVLFEMLTGRLPHEADDPIATAMKRLERPPPHPREANPAVPEGLDALTARLLAKNPLERYPGAAELAEDLRRIRDGLVPLAAEAGALTGERTSTAPTLAAPTRRMPRAGGGSARRPISRALIALLVGVALLGSVAWALTRAPSERGPSDAGRNPGNAALAEVPDLSGLSPGEARRRLEGANLKLGSQGQATSGEAARGTVVGQDPAAGTKAGQRRARDGRHGSGPRSHRAAITERLIERIAERGADRIACEFQRDCRGCEGITEAGGGGGKGKGESARRSTEEGRRKAESTGRGARRKTEGARRSAEGSQRVGGLERSFWVLARKAGRNFEGPPSAFR